MRRIVILSGLVIAAAAWAPIAAAQEPPGQQPPKVADPAVDAPPKLVDRPTIDELIADLDHEEAERREAASTSLMLRDDLDDTRLAKALRIAVSPEQRQRLIAVAMHRFYARLLPQGLRNEHGMGCIGIDIARKNLVRPDQHTELNQPALLVTRTRVGFPAYAVLRPGDLLLSFEGKAFGKDLEDEQALVTLIQQYRAGQRVNMRVLRSGKTIDVTMVLDDYGRLQMITSQLTARDYPQLYEPWLKHLANLLGEAVDPAPVRIDPTGGGDRSARPSPQKGEEPKPPVEAQPDVKPDAEKAP